MLDFAEIDKKKVCIYYNHWFVSNGSVVFDKDNT